MHSSEGDRSLHYKDVEVRDRNKLVQPLKGARPEYNCSVMSDYAQGFDEKPGLIVNSFNFKEPKASLLEEETVILNEATILEVLEGEVLQDIKQNNLFLDDGKGKVCQVEDEDKESKMEDGFKGLEVEEESKGYQLEYEDTKHSKKTSPDGVDGKEYRVKYKDITDSNNFKVSCLVSLLILSLLIKGGAAWPVMSEQLPEQVEVDPWSEVTLRSRSCFEDEWYFTAPNKTQTRICEGMECDAGYKKVKDHNDSCGLVFNATEENTGTYRNSDFDDVHNMTKYYQVVRGLGTHKDKEQSVTIISGYNDTTTSACDAVKNKSSSAAAGTDSSTLTILTGVFVPLAIIGIVITVICFLGRNYYQRKKEMQGRGQQPENVPLQNPEVNESTV